MENKPGILVLTSSYPMRKGDINGGFVHELSRRLTEDFNVVVLAPWSRGLAKRETIDGVKVYRHRQFLWNVDLAYGIGLYENLKKYPVKYLILPFYFFFQMMSLTGIIKKEQIKIIHAHWLIPNGLMAGLYRNLFNRRIKILATIHGSDFLGLNNTIGKWCKRFTLENIDELTVVSILLKDCVEKMGYKKKVHVLPMGIDVNLFTPEKFNSGLRERFQITGLFLLFVGIIVEAKGIRCLINALPAIFNRFSGSKLVIVGEGSLKSEMVQLSKDLNIADQIIFHGIVRHEELPEFFASADLFIQPSLSEGFSLVVMEALSCGTLTMVSDLPVFRNIKSDEEFIIMFEKNNHLSLANSVIKLLEEMDKLENRKINGRKFVVTNFDKYKITKDYCILFQELLGFS